MSEVIDRARLLDAMASLGTAPVGDRATFLMPRATKRILDPQVTVVLGARGSGKSSLASFLTGDGRSLDERLGGARTHSIPLSIYFDAFSQRSTRHADALVLDGFVKEVDDEGLRNYWLASLWVKFLELFEHDAPSGTVDVPTKELLTEATRLAREDPPSLAHLKAHERAKFVTAIDRFEHVIASVGTKVNLAPERVTFTAVYDDLDAVGAFDPTLRARFIRALLAMWSTFSTRYKHIRAKIFLPADLFDLRQFDTLDVSKLMARAERLEWDVPSLYRLTLRHLGAQGADVRAWLESLGVRFRESEGEGWIPDEPSDEATKRWLTATLRSVVAVNGTRSVVQQWIPNRLRDGRDRVAPRSMLTFFRESARLAKERPSRARREHLFSVEDSVDALVTVGARRIEDVREVYEWVDRLLMLRGRVAPLPRAEVEALLASDAPTAPNPTRPRDGRTVTTELVRMGMLRELGPHDQLDVPDLFARPLGVLRRAPDADVTRASNT